MVETYVTSAILGLVLSFSIALVLSGIFKYFGSRDKNIHKKRAAHARPTSRLGGVAVCLAVLVVILINVETWYFEIALASLPIFIAGLMEDLNRPLKPRLRLAVGALSAGIFLFFERHYISDVGIEWVNLVLSLTPVAIAFTIFSIVALINALNFIDGINGLASGKTLIAAFALMWLSNNYNEPNLTLLGAAIFSASLGLFMVNYPQGRIFLGDAGAYTIGFLLAVALITLKSQNPEISAWSIMLVIFWPILDMGHSILRRWLKGRRSDRPDYMHLHHVVMRSIIIFADGRLSKAVANPLATAIILPLAALPVVLGVLYHQNNAICMILFVGFSVLFSLAHAGITHAARRRFHSFLVRL
jgi:UDP-GlcNAc:undecaprenyl-phosphate GlcNAc-1-phosphate transferase